jgi:hypothetical protein
MVLLSGVNKQVNNFVDLLSNFQRDWLAKVRGSNAPLGKHLSGAPDHLQSGCLAVIIMTPLVAPPVEKKRGYEPP